MKVVRNKIFNLLLLLSLCNTALFAHGDHNLLRHWEEASPEPDRIFLTFYGDTATSRAVTWRTDTSITEAVAQIAVSQATPDFDKSCKTLKAKTETLDLNQAYYNIQGKVNYHSVIFDSLTPDTLYAYRVGDGDKHWSEWIQFRTAATSDDPFTFVYFGDAQNGILSHWSRVIRMAYQKAPEAMFAIHAGDLINTAHKDLDWAEWFKAGSFLHSQWTGVPVLGNHELGKLDKKNTKHAIALQWRPQFTLPLEPDLPEVLQETVYSFDFQGMRVIVLNTILETEAQTQYLEKLLKDCDAKWKVITCHYSIFSPAKGRDFPYARKAWKPLLDKYGVDLVLQGHDHTYARGHVPIRTSDNSYGDTLETIYVTSVSGQKMYDLSPEQLESYASQGYKPDKTANEKQFFQVIKVDGNKLSYNAYTADGELYDKATIIKDFATGKKILE